MGWAPFGLKTAPGRGAAGPVEGLRASASQAGRASPLPGFGRASLGQGLGHDLLVVDSQGPSLCQPCTLIVGPVAHDGGQATGLPTVWAEARR